MPITSTGIGSGLDVNSIVTQLVALEKRPLTKLQAVASDIQTKISTYGQVQSLVSNLATAATALAKPSLWTQTWAVTSQSAALSATAKTGATPGTYSVEVNQLAAAHSLASGALPDSTSVVGAGKMKIEFGTWTPDTGIPPGPPSFSANSTSPLNLTFSSATTSLDDIRKAINDANAGVTASIVRDTAGARLSIRSDKTGEVNALKISTTDLADAPITTGLGTLRYVPDTAPGGLTQTVVAANAKVKVNGLDLASATNTFDAAIENVSFTATAVTTAPATLTVSNDGGAQNKAVQEFNTAFNALNEYLRNQTSYDPTSKVGGTLQGDSTAIAIRSQLRSLLADQGAGTLSFLGFTSSASSAPRDGSITMDADKLKAALADPAKLGLLFAGDGSSTGMAQKIADMANGLTSVTGNISTRSQGLKDSLRRNETEQGRMQDRIDSITARLQKQYQALDTRMGQLNALSAYVTQQFSAKNNSNNN